jgi:hypothetical protein
MAKKPSHPEFRELLEDAEDELGSMGPGFEIVREGLLRQRFYVPKATHHMLTERQRTVLKGKVRMSRAWVRMYKIMEETGMTMEEFVKTLSVEELVRGEFRDSGGHFRGRPPKWVPRQFHRACLTELMARGKRLWQENYLKAIEAMTEIAQGTGAGALATPGERIKAAQFVIERMEGKVPERLHITDDKRYEIVLDGIVAEVPEAAIERGRKALESAEEVLVDVEDADVVYEEDFEEPNDDAPPKRKRPPLAHPQPRRRKATK